MFLFRTCFEKKSNVFQYSLEYFSYFLQIPLIRIKKYHFKIIKINDNFQAISNQKIDM